MSVNSLNNSYLPFHSWLQTFFLRLRREKKVLIILKSRKENREEVDSLAQGHPATTGKAKARDPSLCSRDLCTKQKVESALQPTWGLHSQDNTLNDSKRRKEHIGLSLEKAKGSLLTALVENPSCSFSKTS